MDIGNSENVHFERKSQAFRKKKNSNIEHIYNFPKDFSKTAFCFNWNHSQNNLKRKIDYTWNKMKIKMWSKPLNIAENWSFFIKWLKMLTQKHEDNFKVHFDRNEPQTHRSQQNSLHRQMKFIRSQTPYIAENETQLSCYWRFILLSLSFKSN